MELRSQRILIVGGGVAGLTLATALKRQGQLPQIVEIQSEFEFAGAGITLPSNALRALRPFGVVGEIIARGWPMDDGLILDRSGKELVTVLYPRIAGPDIPAAVSLERSELHRILLQASNAAGVPIQLGTTVEAIDEHSSEEVYVTFSDGTKGYFDLVVGADGIRSSIRSLVFGDSTPNYTGFSIFRTIVKRPEDVKTRTLMLGIGTRVGLFPVTSKRLYVFATSLDPENPRYPSERLDRIMKENLADFGGCVPELLAQISSPDQVIYNALVEVDQRPPWHKGRVVILGDAAHASSPFLAQGGAMAIEDAVVLAELLSIDQTLKKKLASYMTRRYERCMHVQVASRRNGMDAHQEDLSACAKRDAMIPAVAQKRLDQFYARLAEPI